MKRLVAVVGLAGSGKSEVVKCFEQENFAKVYFGGLTLEHLQAEGLEVNEVNERMMREKLRAEHGMAAFAILSVKKIKELIAEHNVVIDGLYSWEEYTTLLQEFPNLEILAVYSPPQLRYKRLAHRPIRPLSAAEAQSRDYSQIENLHQAGPIVMANQTIVNTGDKNELIKQAKEYIYG